MTDQKWAGPGSEDTTASPDSPTFGMVFGGNRPPAGDPRPAGRTAPPAPEKSQPRHVPPAVDYQKQGSMAYAAEHRRDNAPGRRSRVFMIAGIGAGALVILLCAVLIFVLLKPGKSGASRPDGTGGSQTSGGKGWSEWMQALPKDVGEEDYVIETRTLYSTRTLETTSSTRDEEMKGWERYKTAEGNRDWGEWSDWSRDEVLPSPTREVQTQTRYRCQDKETATDSVPAMSGWTLEDTTYEYGDYGPWSSWSSGKPEQSETREVEEKTMYRYRDKETSQSLTGVDEGWQLDYTEDHTEAWSDWYDTDDFGSMQNKEVESTQVEVGHRYLIGHYCTGDVPGAQWQSAASNRTTSDVFNANCVYHELGWYDDLSAFTPGNGGYIGTTCSNSCWTWFIMDEETVRKTQYRWRYHYTIYHLCRWSDWSDWLDSPLNSLNKNREIQIDTKYHYRDRSETPVYHFSRWTDWSDWMTTEYRPSETRKVETATFYSYRDKVSETTYFFRRWTDWSEYSETPAEPSDTVEVQTVTQYRYRKK